MKGLNSPVFIRSVLAIGLPLAAVASVILAIGYVNDQQNLRMLANEPQEYLVRDAVLRVSAAGVLPEGFPQSIPIESDPAPYLLFFDASGKAVAGTGLLHGTPPTLPAGVFDTAKKLGVNRLTWQPEANVRQALVVLPVGNGYVVAGRSLTYIEEQESMLMTRALFGWLSTMVVVIAAAVITAWLLKPKKV